MSAELELSRHIEALLVERNLRGMAVARAALETGYYLRAAQYLREAKGTVLIGTGFPVLDTFETDGPVGAAALYQSLQDWGLEPWMVCADPLSTVFINYGYRVRTMTARSLDDAVTEAKVIHAELKPGAVIAIERPGLAADNRYYNMRGEDITPRCAFFDPVLTEAACPTIAIGDGGNEIGMGNIPEAIASLEVHPSGTRCDELLVADVSNWGAYGVIAFLDLWSGRDTLSELTPTKVLNYLSKNGSVDGVSRENTLTEDGLSPEHGQRLINQLRQLVVDFHSKGDS